MPNIKLVSNQDGTYDLLLEYSKFEAEFASEFDLQRALKNGSQKLSKTILEKSKKVKIKTVKILVSGALISTIAFSSFLSVLAASDRYVMGYLYGGTDIQQIEYVNQTNDAIDTVSPSYFDITSDGSLNLNNLSPYFIKTMHEKGVKVVPFLSNHWNRTAGINALKNVEKLSDQIAGYVEQYQLDGINVDIENVTHEQRDQYTKLVKLLREKIPADKEISVAVAANPNDWQTGWHGSYDYAALAKYADHLLIMTYDEHYEGGDAGPVASLSFVEKSIQYALTKTTADKIVIGIPFYGRVWGIDHPQVAGKGVSIKTIQDIIKNCESKVTYDTAMQSVKAEFTITSSSPKYTVGGDTVLQPGKYVVWYENDQSYQAKLNLVDKYDLKGAGAWSLGQEDSSIWDHYEDWIDADSSNEGNETVPPTDSSPGYTIYQVKSGDTLWKIAQSQLGAGNRYPEIKKLNNLTSDTIYPGMQLKIPGKTTTTPSTPSVPSTPSYRQYTVKSGDTLWKIAQAQLGAGNRYSEIKKINNLTSDTIYPGQVLKLPTR
jgi:spore germination protein YaaH